MFQLETLKSKTFWIGLIEIAAGAVLCKVGLAPVGATLIATGGAAIGLRDAIAKIGQ